MRPPALTQRSCGRFLAAGVLVLAAAVAGCGGGGRPADDGERSRLYALLEREWEFRLEEDPLLATSVGDHRYDDRLPSVDPADLERRAGFWRGVLDELADIDIERLGAGERVDYRMFERQLRYFVRDYELGGWQLPLNADYGFHMGFARLHREMPLRTPADYERYLSRLRSAPRYFGQQIANLRRGLERGFSQPRASMAGFEATAALHVTDEAEASVFWAPFAEFAPSVPESERERLREQGRSAILEGAVPAYRQLRDFLVEEYLPGGRTSLGASEMPQGRDYYEEQVRWFTTLEDSPEQIHELGLEEVERIRAEMGTILEQVGFSGSFAAFLDHLRTDSRFYADTPDGLLKEAAYIAKRMDGKLPALFKTLPRLPYTVEPVPAHIGPKFTSARYVGPPWGSTEPGIYWVNTSRLESRPLYTLEALTLHEAVPGHHLQNGLAQELDSLPPFRRFDYIPAFGEGWGLYAERLGLEAGFYQDPYSDFGRLTYEMWRACRLVVDTGVHALGWSREQVIDFLAERTALSRHEIETETDRYITWPGQALAYKMGELKIRELRRRAEAELGERFDLREFHDAVLLQGTVPLGVLELQIEDYIVARR